MSARCGICDGSFIMPSYSPDAMPTPCPVCCSRDPLPDPNPNGNCALGILVILASLGVIAVIAALVVHL